MPFLSDARARIRAIDESAMPGTAQIVGTTGAGKNPDGSPSDSGGTTTSTDTPCRFLSGPAAAEVLADLRLTTEASAALSVPLSTVVSTKDRIAYNGDTYEIVGSNAGDSYATALTLALRLAQ